MDRKEMQTRFIKASAHVDQYGFENKNLARRWYLREQLLRSSSSALLNYGEAQMAQSTKDFIHKLRISLKELNETLIGFRLLQELFTGDREIQRIIQEYEALVSMVYASIKTISRKLK